MNRTIKDATVKRTTTTTTISSNVTSPTSSPPTTSAEGGNRGKTPGGNRSIGRFVAVRD